MAKKEKEICVKCRQAHYCDYHHVLPQALFGGVGETHPLCKNCHDDYHRELGHKYLRKEHKQSEEFYFKAWLQWLYLGVVIGFILLVFSNLL